MCMVSFVGDVYRDRWVPQPWFPPTTVTPNTVITWPPSVSQEDFDNLRREVEEMKKLLVAAKRYDEEHGEPDCEMNEKLVVLRKVAELVGVDLADVLAPEA